MIRNTGLLFLGQYGQDLRLMADEKAAIILGTDIEHLDSHPDYCYIGLDKGEKSLGVDKAEFIISKASLLPAVAETKVIIIDSMEKMTVEAQNKLLKTLEETDVTIMGLAYEDIILPTVKSRMSIVRVPSLKKIVPDDVRVILDNAAEILLSGKDIHRLFSVLNMVAEKDQNSFYALHREYISSFIDRVGDVVISQQIGVKKDYGPLLDVIYEHRKRCSMSDYTKDDFFVFIVSLIENY